MIILQKSKWMLFFIPLFFMPVTFSNPTQSFLGESIEIPNSEDAGNQPVARKPLLPVPQNKDPGNRMPILNDIVLSKQLPSSDPIRTPPVIGKIPKELEALPPERKLPTLGTISEELNQSLREGEPFFPEDMPETPPESILSIGDLEELKDTIPEITPPFLSRDRNFLDSLIVTERQNTEVQTATQQLFKAIESENWEHYRILIKYILMSYSPVQVLAILHSVQEQSENTALHLLAKTLSGELIYELRAFVEAFLPFDRRQRSLSETRASVIPEEFRRTAPGETSKSNLWKLKTHLSLENSLLVKAIQTGNIPAYRKMRNLELLRSGNMRILLAAIYGNTQTGKSLYDFLEEAQVETEEFSMEIENLAKWFTLPLYSRNRRGLTPLLMAQNLFKKKGRSEAFVILSTAETELGINTEKNNPEKFRKNSSRTSAITTLGISCLFSFQNIE